METVIAKTNQKYMNDLIQMKSRERIRCSIEKEDSVSFHVNKPRKDGALESVKIKKRDIEFFEYNYFRDNIPSQPKENEDPRATMTIGLLQANGIIGFDLELALAEHLGLQMGLGLLGADVTLNYHFSKSINSSSIGIAAKAQSFIFNHCAGVGPDFTFRVKGFAFQIGYCVYAGGGSIPFAAYPGYDSHKLELYQRFIISAGGYFTLW